MNKDNSVKKDIWVAIGAIVVFYVMLLAAGWVDAKFGLAQAYTLVDIASLGVKVATASAIAWILKRVIFSNSIGKDFGGVFNEGWAQMTLKEKTRWIIGTFLVLFFAIMLAAG